MIDLSKNGVIIEEDDDVQILLDMVYTKHGEFVSLYTTPMPYIAMFDGCEFATYYVGTESSYFDNIDVYHRAVKAKCIHKMIDGWYSHKQAVRMAMSGTNVALANWEDHRFIKGFGHKFYNQDGRILPGWTRYEVNGVWVTK
jgi:hypothetical protein